MRISALRRKIRNLFKVVLKDPRRKSLFRILFEYTRFLVTDPIVADQYFYKYLYIKGANNFGDYKMTRRLRNRCWKLNDDAYASLLNAQYLFELFFSRFGLSVVRSYAHNINSLFFIQEKGIQVSTVNEFIDILE